MVKRSDVLTNHNKDDDDDNEEEEVDGDPIPVDNFHHHHQQEQQQEQHLDNNYIDYSCSTSIERLARDVETILHNWHVDDGSDRHYSTFTSSTTTTTTTTATTSNRKSCNVRYHEKFNTTTIGANIPLLLRSEIITWNVSFYYSTPSFLLQNQNTKSSYHHQPHHSAPKEKVHCDIQLRLDLWDSPPTVNVSGLDTTGSPDTYGNDADGDDDDDDVLPYSLQRQRHNSIISDFTGDWFTNFSTMFGIGQHITLTPTNPDCFFVSTSISPPQQYPSPMVTNNNDNVDDDDNDTAMTSVHSKFSVPTTTTTKATHRSSSQHQNTAAKTKIELINPSFKALLQYLTHIILHNNNNNMSYTSSTRDYDVGSTKGNDTTTILPSKILSSWLQTALNIAVSHCDCQIPIFGVWSNYHHNINNTTDHDDPSSLSFHPVWIQTLYDIPMLPEIVLQYQKLQQQRAAAATATSKHNHKQQSNHSQREFDTSLSSSSLPTMQRISSQTHINGNVWSSCSSKTTSFELTTVQHAPNQPYFKWNVWGDILHQHLVAAGVSPSLSSPLSSLVHLCQARHIYLWKKQRPPTRSGNILWHALSGTINPQYNNRQLVREWRSHNVWIHPPPYDIDDPNVTESMAEYIYYCQKYVMELIEQALGRHDDDDEPIWGPDDDPIDSMIVQLDWSSESAHPLLTLPLHSRHQMSTTDWEEMVDATESAILDPYRAQKCRLNVVYDSDVAHATLATTQRCTLAALIRTATLPRETLISQLFDAHTLRLWDNQAGNRAATLLCKKAKVDKATRSLVDALDWQHASAEMIERYEAETIVRRVLNGIAAYGFPSPPDNIISVLASDFIDATNANNVSPSKTWNGWKPLRKSAPPGRLLSLLFLQMGRVRSPSSMALVWSVFVDELRRRLDSRESLPNMNYIPGLDPPLIEPKDVDSTSASRSCFLSVGTKAHLAALVNSTEPDPDDLHCLIGQKLQVFNLCLEAMISSDMRQVEMIENRSHVQPDDMEWERADPHEQNKLSQSPSTKIVNKSVVDGRPMVQNTALMNDEGDRDDSSKSTITQEFYDAVDSDIFASPNKSGKRIGARCPIQGLYLTDSGDQMYAPYLQRPYPLTDDVIAERLLILSRQNREPGIATMQQRLQIAHHFQKPKLLSDMRSFKAANPGATFDDFTKWYGNPGDCLSFLGKFMSIENADGNVDSTQDKNWNQALGVAQNFWISTWTNADAVAASEQEPLFDAESTVEVALDFLENVHPAALIGQVVAVNLAMSYFVLSVSKGEAFQIPLVRDKVDRLHAIVDEALQQLSADATKLIDNITFENNDPEAKTTEKTMYVGSIAACTRACEMIAATEFIMSRAKSLLHKLPKQYDMVQKVLTTYENENPTLPISDEYSLNEILNTISLQQQHIIETNSAIRAKPVLRQYMLRNEDDAIPCQLSVRSSDEGSKILGPNEKGWSIVALTRTIRGSD